MLLSDSERTEFESVIVRKRELIRLLTDPKANDYNSTNESVVRGWFISLSNALISYSIEEYRLRKELSERYNLPYEFSYSNGEIFYRENTLLSQCGCCDCDQCN